MLHDMLPKFVADCEEMSDLLQAEQLELDKMSNEINRNIEELYISKSSELLSRYEKIFDLSGTGLTINERRRQLTAKLNAQYSCTRNSLINDLQKMTGLPIELIENYASYTFSVSLVQNNLSEAFVEAVKKHLDMIKPAHLDYVLALIKYDESLIRVGVPMIHSSCMELREVT